MEEEDELIYLRAGKIGSELLRGNFLSIVERGFVLKLKKKKKKKITFDFFSFSYRVILQHEDIAVECDWAAGLSHHDGAVSVFESRLDWRWKSSKIASSDFPPPKPTMTESATIKREAEKIEVREQNVRVLFNGQFEINRGRRLANYPTERWLTRLSRKSNFQRGFSLQN